MLTKGEMMSLKLLWSRVYEEEFFDKKTKNFFKKWIIKAKGIAEDGKTVKFCIGNPENHSWQYDSEEEALIVRDNFKRTNKPV